jgi:hypothetical protein
MTDFPREESLGDLVGNRPYSQGIHWRVFKDLDGDLPGTNVLVVTDSSWTMISATDFRAMAERILKQL